MSNIRPENPDDVSDIYAVNVATFGRENEARLVDQLRKITSTFSFVAVQDGQVIGHLFFSPVEIEGNSDNHLVVLGLAPIAVLPEYQNKGVGSRLVQHGLAAIAQAGCDVVVVLGHPEFYPRFGFIPANTKGLRCEYTVPDDAFMVLELRNEVLNNCAGIIKYHPEFDSCD